MFFSKQRYNAYFLTPSHLYAHVQVYKVFAEIDQDGDGAVSFVDLYKADVSVIEPLLEALDFLEKEISLPIEYQEFGEAAADERVKTEL